MWNSGKKIRALRDTKRINILTLVLSLTHYFNNDLLYMLD